MLPVAAERPKMIQSFLMVGQSNMAGRGFLSEADPIASPRLWVLRNGRWQSMYAPVNGDRPFSGISLAESFALYFSDLHDTDVGLIPCADGGTSLDDWAVGGLLFDHALMQTRLAMRTSRLCGILWHQGEGDCNEERYPFYEEKLMQILLAFRKELGQPQLPIVLGELGAFLASCPSDPDLKNYVHINEALRRISDTHPSIALASAEGLTSNPDMLHFNSASLRILGVRYAKALDALLSSV